MRTLLLVIIALVTGALATARVMRDRSTELQPESPDQTAITAPPSPRDLAESFLVQYAPATDTSAQGDTLFTDIASAVGLSVTHDNAFHGAYRIPEGLGSGAGVLDFDGDGDFDIFIAGGGGLTADEPAQRCRLFRNDGAGFTDVTDSSGAGVPGHAMGVACADYDNDGDTDIFVSRLGPDVLLRNSGDGTFVDVAVQSGVADAGYGASAAFFDYDRDGFLDLYLTRYVEWSPEDERPCFTILGERDYCTPLTYGTTVDRLYRNLGDGRFADVTDAAGIATESGNGLGVLVCDFDDDGWPDVYVANDQTPAYLWHNNGDGSFTNIAAISGCAYDSNGVAIAGMGVASEDIDFDGDFDLLVTNIQGQSNLLLRNEGSFFVDAGARSGVREMSMPTTGFGLVLFDQDHDGQLDGFIANGHVNVVNNAAAGDNPYAQPDSFIRFTSDGVVDATRSAGVAFSDVGRGALVFDADADGDLDVLVTNNRGPVRLLRNEGPPKGDWIIVDARTGTARRAAIGARVTVYAGGRSFIREIRPQQSYLTSGDPRAHFGLGSTGRIERIEIRWPDGGTSVHHAPASRQVLLIEQPLVGDEVGP